MRFKSAAWYFVGVTGLLILLVGFPGWHESDTEFRYQTAIRMHACDIVKNDVSTLPGFAPQRCEVRRTTAWMGQWIDVTCTVADINGQPRRFDYRYADNHVIFTYFFERHYLAQRGGHCGE